MIVAVENELVMLYRKDWNNFFIVNIKGYYLSMRNLSISLWDREKNSLWTEESYQNMAEHNSNF